MLKKEFFLRTGEVCDVLSKKRFHAANGLHVGNRVTKSFIPEISQGPKSERDYRKVALWTITG